MINFTFHLRRMQFLQLTTNYLLFVPDAILQPTTNDILIFLQTPTVNCELLQYNQFLFYKVLLLLPFLVDKY